MVTGTLERDLNQELIQRNILHSSSNCNGSTLINTLAEQYRTSENMQSLYTRCDGRPGRERRATR